MGQKSDLNEDGVKSFLSRLGTRVRDGALAYMGNSKAAGRLDLQNTAETLKKGFLRWAGQQNVQPNLSNINKFLLSNYRYNMGGDSEGDDADDASTANAAPQERSAQQAKAAEQTKTQAEAQPDIPDEKPTSGAPQGTEDRAQGTVGTSGTQGSQAPADMPQQSDEPANPVKAVDPQAVPKTPEEIEGDILKLKTRLYTKPVDRQEAMMAIRDILSVARATGGSSKTAAADFVRKLKGDQRMTAKFPDLENITDADLKTFSEGFERIVECAEFLIENEVRDSRSMNAVVTHFLSEDYSTKKLSSRQLDRVFYTIGRDMIAKGFVKFGDNKGNLNNAVDQNDFSMDVDRNSRNSDNAQEFENMNLKKTTRFSVEKFLVLLRDSGIHPDDIKKINAAARDANGDLQAMMSKMPQNPEVQKKMLAAAMLSMPK